MSSEPIRIKLDRTVCDGFGTCALHAPEVFSLDDWGYPSLRGSNEVAPERVSGVRRAILDCPAHAIAELDGPATIPTGGEPGTARSARPDALWPREKRPPAPDKQ
ncbi:ferredoxin [Microbacterium terrae]|uniref:Ferredoxin n=1 Tax=Microbacterium terrae TaxID=69369 RepID=A0A0M2HI82_9MICO|nr:ferredoxin [Microbacterium terrae]KJL44014.1 hypothetical protein RS81_00587 [Microbacterium terrae]MBP1079452.1 ferredoxin [Microbacterium terrae]GLJ98853.1 hypothetical protein GCM10017594_20500 [Microbacterium terrae]